MTFRLLRFGNARMAFTHLGTLALTGIGTKIVLQAADSGDRGWYIRLWLRAKYGKALLWSAPAFGAAVVLMVAVLLCSGRAV